MIRILPVACLLLAAAAALARAEEPVAVQLAKAELALADAERRVVVAEKDLALAEADSELTAELTDLSRRYGTARALLDMMGKADPKRPEQELIARGLEEDLARLKDAGPKRIALLGQVWQMRVAVAEAKLALAQLRLVLAVRESAPPPAP